MCTIDRDQAEIARAVLGRPGQLPRRLPRLAARPGINPYARLNIHRNNTYASLTSTLIAVFPVTVRLVDERYFRYASHRFIAAHPPNEPRLSRFGAAFPEFLKTFDQLAAMRFVAETARLEWKIATALDQPVSPPLPVSTLNWLEWPEQAVLSLQPSLMLMSSRAPVFSIWTAHQAEAEPDLGFAVHRMPERVMLWRSGANICLVRVNEASLVFVKSLWAGASLKRAAMRALARDKLFDLATALAQLFGDGLVAGVARSAN